MDFFCAMGLRQQPTSSFEGSSCRNPEIASTFSWEKLVLNYRSCSFLLCNHNDLRFNTPAYLQNRQLLLQTTYQLPSIWEGFLSLDKSCTHTYMIYECIPNIWLFFLLVKNLMDIVDHLLISSKTLSSKLIWEVFLFMK